MKNIVFFLCVLCTAARLHAQVKPVDTPPIEARSIDKPINVKIIEEYDDGKGHFIRTIQYEQNHNRITETIIKPVALPINLKAAIKGDTLIKDSVVVVVYKSKYKVDILYRNKPIRSYTAVFGPRPLENKCMEGDRCTPEGWFKIQRKNPASQYDKFMLLSYPDDTAMKRFNDLKERGIIPKTAKIGGNVGIHGTWKGADDMIELGIGWTDGCIALKNRDVEELYNFVGVGTKVYIRK